MYILKKETMQNILKRLSVKVGFPASEFREGKGNEQGGRSIFAATWLVKFSVYSLGKRQR